MPEELLHKAQAQAKKTGFSSVQEFIRESVREKVFGETTLSQREVKLVTRLAERLDKNNSYGTEKELYDKLQ